MKYEITTIKAVAECAGESEVQDALLIHETNDEFHNGDCILFGYSANELTSDEDVEYVLSNSTPETWWIYYEGIFYV